MPFDDRFDLFQLIVIFNVIAFALICLLHHLRFSWPVKACYFGALALSLIQFGTTTIYEHTSDIHGHLHYINYLTQNLTLPPPLDWQSGQPPLFYAAAALLGKAGALLGMSPLYSVRVAAVLFYYGAMVFAGLILRRFVKNPAIFYLSLIAILFWPSAANVSVKVTNDVAALFFAGGFIYFLTVWLQLRKPRDLALTIAFIAGGIAAKGTAILLMSVLATMLAALWWCKEITVKTFTTRAIMLALILLLAGLTLNFGRTLYWKTHNIETGWLINRHDDYTKAYDYVGNELSNYVYFSFHDFIKQPNPNFYFKSPDAHYVWNVLFKTLLLDVGIDHKSATLLIPYICSVFLCLLASLFILVIARWRDIKNNQSLLALLAMAFFAIVMVVSARVMVPVSNQAHGRYIYVFNILLITLLAHFLSAPNREKWKNVPFYFGVVSLASFSLLTLFYSLGRVGWPIVLTSLKGMP